KLLGRIQKQGVPVMFPTSNPSNHLRSLSVAPAPALPPMISEQPRSASLDSVIPRPLQAPTPPPRRKALMPPVSMDGRASNAATPLNAHEAQQPSTNSESAPQPAQQAPTPP